jgi:hypothetical protein
MIVFAALNWRAEDNGAYQVGDGRQVGIEVPSVRLQPTAAEMLGLAIHELATKAIRHGALARIIHDGGDGLSASGEGSQHGCANARDRRPCCWPGIGC